MTANTWVLNFANSIVGVGVLAMPFCFKQCGILLATLMILVSAVLTKKTCEFLLHTAGYTRKSTFEQIAHHVYGPVGKLITEISIIGLLIGTLVAFQVVIGDLSPSIVHQFLGFQETGTLRTILMICSSAIILPLCFLRISSLGSLNAASMCFYGFFIFLVICFSFTNFTTFKWIREVNFWHTANFFNCLPIILIAFTCQTQVFVMYNALPDPTVKNMIDIIDKAINLVASIYITVGSFGYIAFYNTGDVQGDILHSFPEGFFTQIIKLGFWASVLVSYPLMIFPVRVSINSLLYSNKDKGVLHDVISSASDYIAPDKFMYITLSLVSGTLVVGILVPQIEVVLSITGALVGTFLCFVFPSLLFLVGCPKEGMRRIAKIILVVSTLCMIVSTMTVLSNIQSTNHHVDIVVPVAPVDPLTNADEKVTIKNILGNQNQIDLPKKNEKSETELHELNNKIIGLKYNDKVESKPENPINKPIIVENPVKPVETMLKNEEVVTTKVTPKADDEIPDVNNKDPDKEILQNKEIEHNKLEGETFENEKFEIEKTENKKLHSNIKEEVETADLQQNEQKREESVAPKKPLIEEIKSVEITPLPKVDIGANISINKMVAVGRDILSDAKLPPESIKP